MEPKKVLGLMIKTCSTPYTPYYTTIVLGAVGFTSWKQSYVDATKQSPLAQFGDSVSGLRKAGTPSRKPHRSQMQRKRTSCLDGRFFIRQTPLWLYQLCFDERLKWLDLHGVHEGC